MSLAVREPTAIIIGTVPSAAAWVRRALVSRPDVHQPAGGSSVAALTSGRLDTYLQAYADWAGQPVSLDSVDLLRHRARPAEMAVRLGELLPSTRLIAVLSAPWERAAQAFSQHRAAGRIDADVTFSSYLHGVDHGFDPLEVMCAGRYAELLAPFVEGPSPLLVLSEAELLTDPARTWMELLGFLGLHWEADATPRALERSTPEARPWSLPDPGVTDDDRWFCRRFYDSEPEALAQLLGRPIAEHW